MDKARNNPEPLVPLKEQARKAITEAIERVGDQTRPASLRRKFAESDIVKARYQFHLGNFVEAKRLADRIQPRP